MAIIETTHEKILLAIEDFDLRKRNTSRWKKWPNIKSHYHAIEHKGELYPVKEMISEANGQPVNEFTGGPGKRNSNTFARDRGFKIVSINKRNPPWTREELILTLDLYLKTRDSLPTQESPSVIDISIFLNRIGAQLNHQRTDVYRNPNGVYMKLMNIRGLDPDAGGSKGLSHGAKMDKVIWDEFANDPTKCARAAELIRSSLQELEDDEDIEDEVDIDDDEMTEALEGRLVTKTHRRRERSRAIVTKKKKSVMDKTGKLICEACGFNFSKIYGERGNRFIECHHIKPVHEIEPGQTTKLKDLSLLCANCHRMIHSKRPWLTIEELKKLPGIKIIQNLFR